MMYISTLGMSMTPLMATSLGGACASFTASTMSSPLFASTSTEEDSLSRIVGTSPVIPPGTIFGPHGQVMAAASSAIKGGDPRANGAGPVRGGSDIPPDRIRIPPRGGVMVRTSIGWIQLGVPMWTNKDAKEIYDTRRGADRTPNEIPHLIPTFYIFDLDYVADYDGLLPGDFIQYMYFVPVKTLFTLVAPNQATAKRLQAFLDLAFLGPRDANLSEKVRREYPADAHGTPDLLAEMSHGFPHVGPDVLRKVTHLNDAGIFSHRGVSIKKIAPQVYEIIDRGTRLGRIDLRDYPVPSSTLGLTMSLEQDERLATTLQKVLQEGRPGIWPIGTGDGFLSHGESTGFMIWNRRQFILVDPPSITLEYLRAVGIPLEAIAGVILTHGHTDHYGNVIPQLLKTSPGLNLYTTPTIFDMLQRQHELAFDSRKVSALTEWNFVPMLPQRFTPILDLNFRTEYTFHSVPTIGFEIWDRLDEKEGRPILLFSGDTLADPEEMWQRTQTGPHGEAALMSHERAMNVLRYHNLLLESQRQKPPLVTLLDAGIRPLHAGPESIKKLIDLLQGAKVDTSQIYSYHLAAEVAAAAGIPKWQAGHAGFIDLSASFPRRRYRARQRR